MARSRALCLDTPLSVSPYCAYPQKAYEEGTAGVTGVMFALMAAMLDDQWTEHDSAAVRLVSREWRKTHDDNLRRLRASRWTEDTQRTCVDRFSNVRKLALDKPVANPPKVRPRLKPHVRLFSPSASGSLRPLRGLFIHRMCLDAQLCVCSEAPGNRDTTPPSVCP